MKHPWSSMGLAVSVAALAACSQVGGGSVVPGGQPGRAPMTLRAIPIYSPTPAPTPGLISGLVSALTNLTCGVTAGITCHVLAGAGPQGLPARTAAASLPGLPPPRLPSAHGLPPPSQQSPTAPPSETAGGGQTIGIVVAYDDRSLESDLAVYRAKF